MSNLREFFRWPGANFFRQRLRGDEFRKSLLQRLVTTPQRVVFGVGNHRRILLIVVLVVSLDLFAQSRMLGARFQRRQLIDRRRLHDALRRFWRSPDKAACLQRTDRPAEGRALRETAAELIQFDRIGLGLSAFGDDIHAEFLGEGDD